MSIWEGIPASPPPDLPCLFIVGERDPTALPALLDAAKRLVPQLELEIVQEGHWVMIGNVRDVVTEKLVTWVNRVTGEDQAKGKSLL